METPLFLYPLIIKCTPLILFEEVVLLSTISMFS